MTKPFDILKTIKKEELIKLFSEHEANRPIELDTYAHGRINELKNTMADIKFYYIKFNDRITEYLMLPHHGHGINIIPSHGKNISDSLNLFSKKESEFPNSECILKIKSIKEQLFKSEITEWTGDFILISNNKDLAHPGDDHYANMNSEQYFIFNGFHRLMAYFLSMKELNQFRPLHVYYAEVK